MSSTSERQLELVRSLSRMGLVELRAVWAERYGDPPPLRSVDLLRRMLAWKIQLAAMGGADGQLQRALRQSEPTRPALQSGTKAAREWRGVRHEIEVVEKGVLYEGRVYESLSAVARQITGVRWNGPRFFGLRQAA
ncbi:MAG: DUF2924 domain-containing protein [Phenylobacterium sp.]|uniref:DUF2924 domain-containing protein n=1 Tax=Phenylobacterium sp. TaxID=1871053 RepID=UPI002734080A|nr:DUF2924 domain-containing protein [Phenylobacterium sp.]MDP3174805.1 DUF2924 domain-containing protein [Phenylobacterium sp.]